MLTALVFLGYNLRFSDGFTFVDVVGRCVTDDDINTVRGHYDGPDHNVFRSDYQTICIG